MTKTYFKLFFLLFIGYLCIFFISCNSNNHQNKNEFKNLRVLYNKVEMVIPSNFELMEREVLEMKYPSSNRPTEVYTDSGTVSIALREDINAPTTEEDLPKVLKYFVKDLGRIAGIKWHTSEVKLINQKQYCFLEFETPAIDTHIYNLMLASNIDGHLFIVSFNCPVEIKNEWKAKGYEIINSIKLVQ